MTVYMYSDWLFIDVAGNFGVCIVQMNVNTHELPPEAVRDKIHQATDSGASVVTIPVKRDGETCGFFGIDSVSISHTYI